MVIQPSLIVAEFDTFAFTLNTPTLNHACTFKTLKHADSPTLNTYVYAFNPSENRMSWFRARVAKNGVQRARLGETRATPLIFNAATVSVVLVCVLI